MLKRDMKDCLGSTYDVVTLWHVLEHLPDLIDAVADLAHLVRPGALAYSGAKL